MIYQGDAKHRAAYIGALRDLADWLEANPDVPVTSYGHDLQISLRGTEEQQRQDMQDMGAVFGSEPVDPYGDGTHLEVARKFGPVKYFVHFASEAFTEEFNEQQRLGREALAAKKAAKLAATDPETDPERIEADLRDALESASSTGDIDAAWVRVQAAEKAGAIDGAAVGRLTTAGSRREETLKADAGWSHRMLAEQGAAL